MKSRPFFRASCRLLFCLLLALPCGAALGRASRQEPDAASPRIAYRLSIADLAARRLRIAITVDHAPNARLAFAIPAWTPGYYQLLSFEQNIENVRAEDAEGHSLSLTHPDAHTWETEADPTGRVTLTYQVHASEAGLGFFGSALNPGEREGYINGASAFMYLVGQTAAPVRLSVALPPQWQIVTPLTPASGALSPTAPSLFTARNYDELIDCPLQLGQFQEEDFAVSGVPFRCVLVGRAAVDRARMAHAIARIVQAAFQVFDAPDSQAPSRPFRRYTFIYHFGGPGFFGGLEHRNSTVIHLAGNMAGATSDGFLSVTAHEFFHAWNVKRLRPAGLGPFDYTRPVRVGALWFAEGVTDYYAQLLLYRAGLRDRQWFLNTMADRIATLDSIPARTRVSLEEASRKAWEGGSEGFDGLSYYLKGSLVGFYFDLRLRALTGGRRGWDDVLRELDRRYGQRDTAYPETALLDTLNAVAGADLSDEYNRYVKGTDEIAWDDVLASAGLQLRRTPTAYLGIQMQDENRDAAVVQGVEENQAGARMGLQSGDVIIRLNGRPVDALSFAEALRSLPAQSPLTLQIERGGQALMLSGDTGVQYTQHSLIALPGSEIPATARHIREAFFATKRLAQPLSSARHPYKIHVASVRHIHPADNDTRRRLVAARAPIPSYALAGGFSR
ncbi:MAG TPA: PDZ domain-containing protein [Chthonomonadaceae bacterium]|nr:PDZ domain-containing protein [Chthonomonadaceae bacterium]